MQSHDVAAALRGLSVLQIGPSTTAEDAMAAIRPLGSLNRCTLGVTRFVGLTPWERHADGDELLYVVEGAVVVTVLTEAGSETVSVPPGSIFVVPRGLWHRQHADTGAALLFATGETDVSWADDPRLV